MLFEVHGDQPFDAPAELYLEAADGIQVVPLRLTGRAVPGPAKDIPP